MFRASDLESGVRDLGRVMFLIWGSGISGIEGSGFHIQSWYRQVSLPLARAFRSQSQIPDNLVG